MGDTPQNDQYQSHAEFDCYDGSQKLGCQIVPTLFLALWSWGVPLAHRAQAPAKSTIAPQSGACSHEIYGWTTICTTTSWSLRRRACACAHVKQKEDNTMDQDLSTSPSNVTILLDINDFQFPPYSVPVGSAS